EPFSGLDPLAVDVVVDVLKERAKAGVPVLFSSHQLDIVERLCDELVIIAGGEIRAAGSRTELLAHNRVLQYELSTTGDLGWIRTEPGIRVIDFDGGRALFDVDSEADAQRVLQRAVASSTVTAFSPVHTSLAQIFREVIR
ncbi:MAG: ATP-binding protein DrrA1-3 family domain-containing protein, partial [Mycetocola sp.]